MVEFVVSFIELYIWAYTPLSIDFSHSFSISCLSDFIQWPCWGRDAKSGTHACAIFSPLVLFLSSRLAWLRFMTSFCLTPKTTQGSASQASVCGRLIEKLKFMISCSASYGCVLNWISRAVLKLTLATMIGEDEFNLHRYWLENGVI